MVEKASRKKQDQEGEEEKARKPGPINVDEVELKAFGDDTLVWNNAIMSARKTPGYTMVRRLEDGGKGDILTGCACTLVDERSRLSMPPGFFLGGGLEGLSCGNAYLWRSCRHAYPFDKAGGVWELSSPGLLNFLPVIYTPLRYLKYSNIVIAAAVVIDWLVGLCHDL